MKNYMLECCVDSVESAIEAQQGGAKRLELCSGLVIGGLTPTKALFQSVKSAVDIKLHVLIRPRFGDFCYTKHEFAVMREEVRMFKELGADGVVIGSLNPDGTLCMEQMWELIEIAKGMSITLHRAFDMCMNPLQTLQDTKKLGIDTILTSGQSNHCIDGTKLLNELVEKANGEMDIMIGGGVDASVISYLYRQTGATSYHMSGKIIVDSSMQYRKETINMGVADINEYDIWRTSAARVSEARKVLEEL